MNLKDFVVPEWINIEDTNPQKALEALTNH